MVRVKRGQTLSSVLSPSGKGETVSSKSVQIYNNNYFIAKSAGKPLHQTQKSGGSTEAETVNKQSEDEIEVELQTRTRKRGVNNLNKLQSQTKKAGCSSGVVDEAETMNLQSENEEEVELPAQKLKLNANGQSKMLPQTKKPGQRSEVGDAESINMYSEEEEDLPPSMTRCRTKSQSKSLPQSKNSGGNCERSDVETMNQQYENEEEVELPTQTLQCRSNSQSTPLSQTKKGHRREVGYAESEVELSPPLPRHGENSQSKPLPQTEKLGDRNAGADVAETISMQSVKEEEVELPSPLPGFRANSQSEPLPQTMLSIDRSEGGDAESVNMQSEMEEPPLLKHNANSQSEGDNINFLNMWSENEKEVELPPALLRLYVPNTTCNKNQLPENICQVYAEAAESVKKALISELKSQDSFDVESMVDLANDAFASLASLHANFDDLYNSVRDFILHQWELSEANKELGTKECLQEMEALHSELCDQSDRAHKALLGAKISLVESAKLVTPIVDQIVETKKLLKDLEEKLMEENEKIGAWQDECDKLENAYGHAKAKEKNFAEKIEEHKRILEPINSRRDKAMFDVERTKVLLASMCELDNGNPSFPDVTSVQ